MPMNLFEAALGATAALFVPLAAIGLVYDADRAPRPAEVATVAIVATTVDYPVAGEFLRDGIPVAAPVERVELPAFGS